MNRSESIKEIATALSKAQGAMGGAVKGTINHFFKSSYSDLGAVVNALKIPFAENGLSYAQFPSFSEGKVGVETILMHISGEWMSSELTLPAGKQDAQGAGSAITYARRYALQSMAGIPSEDDDGNLAAAADNPVYKKETNYKVPDYTVIIKKYQAANRDDQVKMWGGFSNQQQAAVNQAMKAKAQG